MLGRDIEIIEIDNGWVVKEFSVKGSTDFDKTFYLKTFDEVLEEIKAWKEILDEQVED